MFDGNESENADTNNSSNMVNTAEDSGYSATRTSTTGNAGMTNSAWVWLIIGIVGIMIVALVWYYVAQDTGVNNN